MAIAAVFEFPNDSADKYEQVFQAGGVPILDQPGRLHHVCYRTETGFTVVDVWADEQSFAAFGQIIGPATQQAGLDAKPMVYPVQGMIGQDGKRSR
jgi:heme-degrading monooxygenase HmoA